ncbi:MAG: spermidine/putrescine transporter permease [Acidimicrobiales bacterium]|nr:spermidine/putrescine transporter permease [Acidimicrobiales bacterium]
MGRRLDGDQGLTRTARQRAARFVSSHRGIRLGGLLAGPLLWIVGAYIGALIALLVTSLYHNETTGLLTQMVTEPGLDNYRTVVDSPVYRDVALRTVGAALAVTAIDLAIALPVAFYMAKVASTRSRRRLVIAVTMPLWAGYLVKGYAWRAMLNPESGLIKEVVGATPGYGLWGTITTLSYLWLPYMVIPIYAGLDRLPNSLLEASTDLGGTAGRTFRSVVLPLLLPSIVAGSIFTFSLSLGDFYVNRIFGGTTQFIGNNIYSNFGVNLPLAAAYATVPVLIMAAYLLLARATGALKEL